MLEFGLLQLHDYNRHMTPETNVVLPLYFIQGLDNIRHHLSVLYQEEHKNQGRPSASYPFDSPPPILLQQVVENNRVIGRVPYGTVRDHHCSVVLSGHWYSGKLRNLGGLILCTEMQVTNK